MEDAARDRLNRERLAKLQQALDNVGIWRNCAAWNIAILMFHITKNTGGEFEWTNSRIAAHEMVRCKKSSVKKAIQKLRAAGILQQETVASRGRGNRHACRRFDWGNVNAISVGDLVGETVGDLVGETVGDLVGETVGENSALLISVRPETSRTKSGQSKTSDLAAAASETDETDPKTDQKIVWTEEALELAILGWKEIRPSNSDEDRNTRQLIAISAVLAVTELSPHWFQVSLGGARECDPDNPGGYFQTCCRDQSWRLHDRDFDALHNALKGRLPKDFYAAITQALKLPRPAAQSLARLPPAGPLSAAQIFNELKAKEDEHR